MNKINSLLAILLIFAIGVWTGFEANRKISTLSEIYSQSVITANMALSKGIKMTEKETASRSTVIGDTKTSSTTAAGISVTSK